MNTSSTPAAAALQAAQNTPVLTYSSELMQNYKQAQIMSPDAQFEALQTDTGLSLLFSVGTDGAMYLTQESTGDINHANGWSKSNISAATLAADFAGKTGVKVSAFDVAQSVNTGAMDLAMVLGDGTNSHLYLSLGNSASNTAWTAQPVWTACAFDDPNNPQPVLVISQVFLSEAADGQYIVVDVLRDPSSPTKLVRRYYIDPAKTGGYAWHPHDLSIDLMADRYSSCLGRQAGQTIDGLYTIGHTGSSAQFTYQPLYNVWNPGIPASPARLALPGNLVPDAIATCRNSDNSTDLYATAQGALYYFASTNQKDGAVAVAVDTSVLYSGVSKLLAYVSFGKVVVWGLNGSDQAFYTACASGQQGSAHAFSEPLPIATGVELLSPYMNRADSGNTFFAAAGNQLYKFIQSCDSTLWTRQQITLPALSLTTPAQKFSSYTTRLQLTDTALQVLAGVPLMVSAQTRCAFYINHLYYVLDTTPVSICTDTAGSITLIEAVGNLTATRLHVSAGAGPGIDINPMDKPMNKMATLSSADSVQKAQIQSSNGSSRALVAPGTSSNQLAAVASAVQGLSQSYQQQAATMTTAVKRPMGYLKLTAAPPTGFDDAISVAIGDLFNWLASGVQALVQIVKNAASDVWHFIATIAGKVYSAVLDTVEAVVGALQWVFNAIKTTIEDLIAFLEFLFEWADITRTQKVLKNLTKLWLNSQVDDILVVKGQFDSMIANVEKSINAWAGIDHWGGLGAAATAPMNSSSTPAAGQNAPSTLLSSHFQGNAGNLTQTNPPPPPVPSGNPIDVLFQALKAEGAVMDNVLGALSDLAGQWPSLSLEQALTKLIAILADGVLSSAQVVVDALLDILYDVAKAALAVLDTPVYIPVVTDILSEFGVPSISMLDLFCWIAAVPVTLAYKAAHNAAPFPDNADTRFLISSTSFSDVQKAFSTPQAVRAQAVPPTGLGLAPTLPLLAARGPLLSTEAALYEPIGVGPLSLSPSSANSVFILGHMGAAFFTLMSCFVDPFEAADKTGDTTLAVASGILAILAGASVGLAVVLSPQHPIQNTAVVWVNRATLGMRVLGKLVFCGPAQEKFGAASGIMNRLKVADGRATGAIVDAILVIPAAVCSCWHFYELSQISAGASRSNAIIEETANMTAYLSRIGYSTAVNTEGVPQAVAIGAMVVSNVCYAGLEVAEAVVGFQES